MLLGILLTSQIFSMRISVELGQATVAERVSISAVIATFLSRSVKLRSRVLLMSQALLEPLLL